MRATSGQDALMQVLRGEGTEYIFGLPGATEIIFMAAMESQTNINYILCLQENIAIGAAEGYARTFGKPGVVNLHTYAGTASSLGMMVNAWRGNVPLVITAGVVDSRIHHRDPHLTGPLVKLMEPFTKWQAQVNYAYEIPVLMQRAFKMAQQPPAGPVFVAIPQDILEQTFDYRYQPPMKVYSQLRPDSTAITAAAELLLAAKNTAIFIGEGIARNNAQAEVINLAELIGARVYQYWMADVNFPNQHPLYLGEINPNTPSFRDNLEPFDVLIAIGSQLFGQWLYMPDPLLPHQTHIIQIDDNPWEIGKNFPVDVGMQGNIKATVAEIVAILSSRMTPEAKSTAQARIKEITAEKEVQNRAVAREAEAEKDDKPISISRLVTELETALKPGTIIIDDSWSSSSMLRCRLNLNEPLSFQRSRGGGSIGWGLCGAIGTKLAAPERPVVAVCGDGSAIWSIQSLWTAAHYKLPITFIIITNASYQTVKISWSIITGESVQPHHLGSDLDNPRLDFVKLAEGMGMSGHRVTSPGELGSTLRQVLNSSKPELVEVFTQKKTVI